MKREDQKVDEKTCRTDAISYSDYRSRLSGIVEKIVAGCDDSKCYAHIDYEQLPSQTAVIEILNKLRAILFPGYFNNEKLDPVNLNYYIGKTVSELFDMLSEQISRSIRHDCFKYNLACTDCAERGFLYSLSLLEAIPELQDTLGKDIIFS